MSFSKKPYSQELPTASYKIEDDDLITLRGGSANANAYFTCGDLVVNFNKESGEILSLDAYLPYLDTVTREACALPKEAVPAALIVDSTATGTPFNIEGLPVSVSKENGILHIGKANSAEYVAVNDSLVFGISNSEITDIFIQLTNSPKPLE